MDDLLKRLLAYRKMSEDDFNAKVNEITQDNQENPSGIHKSIKLITDQTKINLNTVSQEDDINSRIQSGEINSITYPTLSSDEQNLVKLVLFKNYSPHLYDVPKKLSALEFLTVAMAQFMDKVIDKTLLTADEQSYWTALVNLVMTSQQPINDTSDWRLVYLQNEFNDTQTNRNDYFTEKHSIVGDPIV